MEDDKISQSVPFMGALTLNGGFLSCFIFITSLGRFTNGQTGNTTKFAINFAELDFLSVILFLLMILCCISGSVFCSFLKDKFSKKQQQKMLLSELLMLICLFVFSNSSIFTPALATFIAGFQASMFRTCHGEVCNTTFCTGGYRAIGENIYATLTKKQPPQKLINSLIITCCFIFGSILCSVSNQVSQTNTYLIPILLISSCFTVLYFSELNLFESLNIETLNQTFEIKRKQFSSENISHKISEKFSEICFTNFIEDNPLNKV